MILELKTYQITCDYCGSQKILKDVIAGSLPESWAYEKSKTINFSDGYTVFSPLTTSTINIASTTVSTIYSSYSNFNSAAHKIYCPDCIIKLEIQETFK